tara:strand:- start:133 stop:483 length:351 start_codon:yes stop_codon:yes gene_type:complete
MKTTIHKGKVYQIGGRYVDKNGNIGLLDSCDGRTFKMSSESKGFWFCNELATFEMGAIEDAPLELESGGWYMCDLESGNAPLQWYTGAWLFSNGVIFSEAKNCSVIPLYKMIKEYK